MEHGKLIVVEGIDGSGKSTLSAQLSAGINEYAEDESEEDLITMLTQEPSDLWTGRKVRSVLSRQKSLDSVALQELFVVDRIQHSKAQIDGWLDSGRIVISDRFLHSTIAYGGVGDQEWRRYFIERHEELLRRDQIPKPDLTLWIDVPSETATDRLLDRQEEETEPEEIFEKQEFLDKTREVYQHLFDEQGQYNFGPMVRIDNSGKLENALKSAEKEVRKIL